MEAIYKVSLLASFTLLCLIQLPVSQANQKEDVTLMRFLPTPPGERCSWWHGCNKKHTRCKQWADGCGKQIKTCECKDGYMLDYVTDTCMEFREVNSKCTLGEDICPDGATCTGSPTKCICTSGIFSEDEEVCGRRYKESCTSTAECNQQRGPLTCVSGFCECGTGTEYVKDMGKKCLPKAGTKCTKDSECYGQQYCNGGTCACPSGQKFDGDSYQCVASNALTNVARGSECTPFMTTSGAKVCAFGYRCFPCNQILGIWQCVEYPTAIGTRPVHAAALLFFSLLMTLVI